MTRRVFVWGPGAVAYRIMFAKLGFKGANCVEDADIVCFTGGEDVDPQLYGELALPQTHFNPARDKADAEVYNLAFDKFKVGICRGGQFLNVMNGGKMWQHVDSHTSGHFTLDLDNSKRYWCSSTHHQQMRPAEGSIIIGVSERQASVKASAVETYMKAYSGKEQDDDVEVVYYPETMSLCFQPHPEFEGYTDCTNFFSEVLERYWQFAEGVRAA